MTVILDFSKSAKLSENVTKKVAVKWEVVGDVLSVNPKSLVKYWS